MILYGRRWALCRLGLRQCVFLATGLVFQGRNTREFSHGENRMC